ncbi:hypothetical protein XI08_15590 [Bradyrhizobium sp. CCBAU 11361]|nr:hypothetical protein [Bradyrhizobium sp. CCBAU 11361]
MAGCCWSGRKGSRFNLALLRLRDTGLSIAAQSDDKAPFADRLRTRKRRSIYLFIFCKRDAQTAPMVGEDSKL